MCRLMTEVSRRGYRKKENTYFRYDHSYEWQRYVVSYDGKSKFGNFIAREKSCLQGCFMIKGFSDMYIVEQVLDKEKVCTMLIEIMI